MDLGPGYQNAMWTISVMWCWCKHPSITKPLHSRWVFNQLFARVILRYFSTEVNTNHFDQLVPKQFTAIPHSKWAKPLETGWKWCDSRRFHWISHRIRPTLHLEPCGNQLSDFHCQVSTSFPAGHAGIEAWRKGRKDMSWQKCEGVFYSVATSLLFLWSSLVELFCSNIGFHSISHIYKNEFVCEAFKRMLFFRCGVQPFSIQAFGEATGDNCGRFSSGLAIAHTIRILITKKKLEND